MDIVLGIKGIGELQRTLKQYEDFLKNGVSVISEKLGSEAQQVMEELVPNVTIDGNLIGVVTREVLTDGQRVSYEGDDVAYIEFGTGIVGAESPYPTANSLGWDYDINLHGWDGWYYTHKETGNKEHSVGMPPIMPVYETAQRIEDKALMLIKEVIDEKFS